MVKSTSLASVITLMEVTGIAKGIISETFRALPVFACAAIDLSRDQFLHRRGSAFAGAPAGGRRRERGSAVAVRDLRKRYGPLEVLRGVSLEARTGEVISIVGASGSGKSTLLRCIPLLEVPEAGEVGVGGEWLAWRPPRQGAGAGRGGPGEPACAAGSASCSSPSTCGRT